MSAYRRRHDNASDRTSFETGLAATLGAGRIPAQEAFDYEDDVHPEVVVAIQERANKFIGDRKLVVIDGYAGKK